MSVVPGELDTERQPPMTVPLRHFVVGVGFLLLGGVVGVAVALDAPSLGLAHVHLLLAGWVCVTIMGAMTQFVPVWSGVRLHSRRLAVAQLWLVVVGALGFAGSLAAGRLPGLPLFGAVMALGFWAFVYNVARTLARSATYDVTERHFALALGFFLLVPALGVLLAVGFVRPVFAFLPVTRAAVVRTHATLAVFGAVLTTVLGALYQLAPMFTQTELHGVDAWLRRAEEVGYPVGVVLLAGGRLVESGPLAAVGGALVAGTLVGVGLILGRRLHETRVDWTPMLSRYAVVAAVLPLWASLALVAWVRRPNSPRVLFGAPGTAHLLVVGVVGFVVLGTLYHVVPFIVWVHRYSDRLGYEPVPMVDDLYDDRLAAADFASLLAGTVLLVAADQFGLPPAVAVAGGLLVLLGTVLFLANVLLVVRDHSPHSVLGVLFAAFATDQAGGATEPSPATDEE
ncbi:MAG: hypothetical protein ABEJ61_06050 [Haloferacaceae archaeon]